MGATSRHPAEVLLRGAPDRIVRAPAWTQQRSETVAVLYRAPGPETGRPAVRHRDKPRCETGLPGREAPLKDECPRCNALARRTSWSLPQKVLPSKAKVGTPNALAERASSAVSASRRSQRAELSRGLPSRQPQCFCPLHTLLRPYSGKGLHEDGREQAFAVGAHGVQRVRRHARAGERPGIEIHGSPRLLAGNPVAARPAFGVEAAVGPVVLTRDGLPLERAGTARSVNVCTKERTPAGGR